MKKTELLSPAGDLETLKIAVKAGADAVYISGKEYGARKFAPNFDIDEIKEATKYCHKYNVKIYITVNTLIEEQDIEKVTKYIKELHTIGVDAIIMQDIGMISYIKEKFPNLEIHASTQTHNCSQECIDYLKSLNVSRVVLARELSKEEIKSIKTPLELEVFIHGALCVSYSGECLISSYLYNRSGNKGECSQVCRFKFDLYKNSEKQNIKNKYLLSMKELCAGETIKELLDMNISSLKIEGRMKSKYYVGYVTKFYRTLIDNYYNKKEQEITKEELEKLLTLYNREFTKGYLNNEKDLVNSKTCNHQGIVIGEVLDINKKIKIRLEKDLNQGDGIRFSNNDGMIVNYLYNDKGLLVNKVEKNNIAYLDNKINLKNKGLIYKTNDIKLNKEIETYQEKKIPIYLKIKAQKNEKLALTATEGKNTVTKYGNIVEKANKNITTKEEIKEKLSKLGNTPFTIEKIDYEIDNDIFIPLKNINNLRQEVVFELINLKTNTNNKITETTTNLKSNSKNITNEISILVRNEKQLKYLLTKNVNIYTEAYNLYNKYKNDKVFYRNPRASFTNKEVTNELISNNGNLITKKEKGITDIYMNVKNTLTINEFLKYVYKVGLSPELKDDEIEYLIKSYYKKYKKYPNVEILIYGNLELMLMKHCPINHELTKNNCKNSCNMCEINNYSIESNKDYRYQLLKDENHDIRVMSNNKINNLNKIDMYKNLGITNFRIDLLDETEEEIEDLLKTLKIDK